jgi:peptide/nickel transport system ATP-binding protein
MKPLIQIDNLAVEYTTEQGALRALDGAALTVAAGESVGVVGESGSGKSTLAQATGRILPPGARRVAGDIAFEGQSVFDYNEQELRTLRRCQLGFIFQNPMQVLNPTMRVGKQMAYIMGTNASDPVIAARFERVGLKDPTRVGRRYPHELSGGMAQRIVIAMAIAREPRLLIADEPTSSLDSTIRGRILELLFSFQALTGASLLLFTHDLRSVARFCKRVAVMYGGVVVEVGASDKVFSRPAHPYARALLRAAPGTEEIGARIEAIPGRPPILRERSEQCVFAPRCRYAVDVCKSQRPEAQLVDGRQVLCHRAVEVVNSTFSRLVKGDDKNE